MRFFFAWYDFWIGAYWERQTGVLYICPFPMIVLEIQVMNLWHKFRSKQWMDKTQKDLDIMQERAEANDYESIDDWLHGTAWSIRYELDKRGTSNVSQEDIYLLLLEENGDREKVLQGYLED